MAKKKSALQEELAKLDEKRAALKAKIQAEEQEAAIKVGKLVMQAFEAGTITDKALVEKIKEIIG